MGVIASTSFDHAGNSWAFDVSQTGQTDNVDLHVTDFRRIQGGTNADILSPVLSTRVEMSIQDDNAYLSDRIKDNPLEDFTLDITLNSNTWFTGTLINSPPKNDQLWSSPQLRLTFGDNLHRLKRYEWTPDEPAIDASGGSWRPHLSTTDAEWHTIAETFALLLRPLTSLDVRTYWGWKHSNQSGKKAPEGHRLRPTDLDRRNFPPTRMSALKELLRAHNAYIVQANGKWVVVDRLAQNSQPIDFAEWNTADPPVRQSTGTSDQRFSIADSDVRAASGGQAIPEKEGAYRPPRSERAKHKFPYGTSDFAPFPFDIRKSKSFSGAPEWDVWSESGTPDYDSTNNEVTIQPGEELNRESWEQPAAVLDITIDGYITVKSNVGIPANGTNVPVAELVGQDLNSSSTQTINIQIFDGDQGTQVSFSVTVDAENGIGSVGDPLDVDIRLFTDADPDGDAENEVDSVTYQDVSAAVSKPSNAQDAPIKQSTITFSIYDIAYDTPVDTNKADQNNKSGAIEFYDGSNWVRLKDFDAWNNRVSSNNALQVVFGDERNAQFGNLASIEGLPIDKRVLTTDFDGTAPMIRSYDRDGKTYIPVQNDEKPLEEDGKRTLTLIELAT